MINIHAFAVDEERGERRCQVYDNCQNESKLKGTVERELDWGIPIRQRARKRR